MSISLDQQRTGDILDVTLTVDMPTIKVSQFAHVGQSFDDYRYELISQAESKLRSYIEATAKTIGLSDD